MRKTSPRLLIVLFLHCAPLMAQNTTCINAIPFCTQIPYEYPATVNISYSEPGHDYGCLLYTKNPAWFYLLIERGGSIQLRLLSKPSADIDYVCWGPFDSLEDACMAGLPASKVVDCGNSIDPEEYCDVQIAFPGEYYILMITNYSNDHIRILLSQSAGFARTDCGIVNPLKLEVPSAFSPNGDGLNDTFKVLGESISSFHLIICDRWGRVVFETRDIYQGWDGTLKGLPAPVGLYYYNIFYEGNDMHNFVKNHKNGVVMLVR